MYSPYGQKELLSSDAAYVEYAGMRLHEPSGLYLTYYRAYDPKLGRWLSRDPIGEAGGLNLYGYVGCRPGSYTDPWGLSPEDAQRIYDGIGHCTRQMSREGLRLPAELRFINNSIPGKVDCGEQVEYLINKCLSKLTDLDDNWSFLPRSGWGHTWGMARSSNSDDPIIGSIRVRIMFLLMGRAQPVAVTLGQLLIRGLTSQPKLLLLLRQNPR